MNQAICRRTAIAYLASSCLGLKASAQTANGYWVRVRPAFCDGKRYMRLSVAEKTSYLMGLHDGLTAAAVLGAPETEINRFQNCIPGLDGDQLRAIVDKFLNGNPDRWGQQMSVLLWAALPQNCRG